MDTSIDTLVIEIESSSKEASGGIDSLITKLEALKVKVNENLKALGRLNSAIIQLNANSKSFTGLSNIGNIPKTITTTIQPTTNVNDFSSTYNELSNIETKMDSINQKPITIDTSSAQQNINTLNMDLGQSSNTYDRLGESANNTGNKLKNASDKGSKAFQRLGNILSGIMSTFSKIGSAVGRIASVFGGLFNLVRGQGTSSMNNMGNSVDNLVRKLRMTTLALLGTRGAFTAIRKAVSEYMAYDTALAKTLQQDWAILGALIAPILERIISLFSTLIAYIATFVKMLTGVDLVARANKKSLGGVGSSAGSTAKKVKELNKELGNLQKFDDLNVVDFPKDSGSSGGGGGGAGGGGAGIEPLKLPEIDTSPIDKLWEYIKADRWYALGMDIAHKFNNAIRTINFDYLIEKAREWGKNFADFFNGLRDGLDGELLGKQLAGALNTAFNFVDSFFATYNFERLGIKLADIFNSLIENVQWDTLGRVLTAKIRGLFDTIYTFSTSFNWKKLGESAGKLINSGFENIDLGKASTGLSNSIIGLFEAINTMSKTIDFDKITENFNNFINNLDLSGIGTKVNEFIQIAYDEAIKFLGKLDWNEIGRQIGEFLGKIDWVGILVKGVLGSAKFKEGLRKLGLGFVTGFITSIVESLAEKFMPVIATITEKFGEISNKIREWWEGVKTWFGEKFQKAKTWVGDKITGIKDEVINTFVKIRDGIKEKITNAINWIKEKFTWSNIKATFENIKSNISTKFTDIRDDIKEKMKNAVEKLKSFFTWENIKKTFTTLITKIKEKFGEIGTNVGKILSSKFNSIVSSIINKAVDAINGFIRAVNKAINAINKIPGVDLKKLSTIDYPKLATGTNKIEAEGLYHLHKDEAVIPKKYNPAVNNKMYSENNNKVLEKLDSLMEMLNNMEYTNVVNIGNEKVYKGTTRYINRQRNIYGTDVV